jgi:TRAP-type mannitol/chloroaromatic compound transport system substrate-binding protein
MLTRVYRPVVLLLALALLGGSAAAQTPTRDVTVDAMRSERRVALVIGNGAYPTSPLRNPVNDARDVARTLRGLGFDVLAHENLSQRDMKLAITDFGRRLRGSDVGLFFFAGHGLQVSGRNYLMPVDASPSSEEEADADTIDVATVLARMATARNRLNIVILDACRDNPFVRSFRSTAQARGLAAIDRAPIGTLIAYATSPGMVARDGEGRNGLYTSELLKALPSPGLRLEDVFKRVRFAVRQATNGEQIPWEASSVEGEFMFALPAPGAPAVAAVAPPPSAPEPPRIEVHTETRPALGTLVLTTQVPAVDVWLGTQRLGAASPGTTLVVSNLAAGKHRITARKDGHRTWDREVEIVAHQRVEVVIDIEPLRPEPAPPPVTDTRTHRWKLQSAYPASNLIHQSAERLAATIAELSQGRVRIEVHPAGAIVPVWEISEAVRREVVEAGYTQADFLAGKAKWAPVFSGIPFGLTAEQHARWMTEGGGLALQRELYPRGLGLDGAVFPAGTTGDRMAGWFRKPVNTLRDLRGMKVRATGPAGDVLRESGVSVVNLPGGELIPALERGAIDGASWGGPALDLSMGFHNVLKTYYRSPGWQPPATSVELQVSAKAYQALGPDLQAVVAEAARRNSSWMLDDMRRRNTAALAELTQRHGVQVLELPDPVLAAVRAAAERVYERNATSDADFKRVYESMRRYSNR